MRRSLTDSGFPARAFTELQVGCSSFHCLGFSYMHLEGTVAESVPCFPRCAGIRDGSVIVLSGPCLYARTSSISKDGGWLERHIVLEVTADFSRSGCEISRICVFTVDHDELIDVIPLGVRGNRSCVRSGCIRPSDSHAAECSLGVDGRELLAQAIL